MDTVPNPVPIPPEFYDELRSLAGRILGNRRHGTLAPTSLVHEAFLRLSHAGYVRGIALNDFFRLASRAMRTVLIDHVRRRRAIKRGPDAVRLPLDDVVFNYEERAIDLLALDNALAELEKIDPRLNQLIDLRFFCGLTESEAADVMGISSRTVRRDWRIAKAWLRQKIGSGDSHVG